jgi:hypothetical protein
MPRPSKLTPALQAAIVQAVSQGVPFTQAAWVAGIADATALEWLQRGEGSHPTRPSTARFAAFAEAMKKAEAQDEARRVERINQAAQGGTITHEKTITKANGDVIREVSRAMPQWQADAWHLERKYPERWGRKDHLDLTVNIQALAKKVAEELGVTAEELLAEAAQLLKEGRNDTC